MRIIDRRGARCGVRQHEVGFRLQLWEMLAELEPVVPLPVRQQAS